MSEKAYINIVIMTDLEDDVKHVKTSQDIVVNDGDGGSITATPQQIYDALDKVGREVPITYRGKIITDGASCRKCNFVLSETNIENAHCDLRLDKSSTHHENTPSPACPGTGDYEVVLRRKGVSGDDKKYKPTNPRKSRKPFSFEAGAK